MEELMLSRGREGIVLALQAVQVLFLGIHDWVPLGRLNDVRAVRSQDTPRRLIGVTVLQTAPFAFGLVWSGIYMGHGYPHWLMRWLVISYAVLLAGQMRAWWLPYLVRAEPERARRYAVMFGATHSFLPPRNGIVPNTAHVLLHLATAATLFALLVR